MSDSLLDRLEHPEGRPAPPRRNRGVIGTLVAAITVIAAKAKLFALFALKFGVTAWTMLIAVWVYSSSYGWPFAALLVGLILIHEIGHGLAAWKMGIRVGAPVFIPFFGAFIALRDRPSNRWVNFVISAGGPLLGGLAALACLGVAQLLDGEARRLVHGGAFFALVINLFNLMPIWILDGAKMLPLIGTTAAIAGLVVAGAALVSTAVYAGHVNVMGAIVLAVAAVQVYLAARSARRPPSQSASLLERVTAPPPPSDAAIAEEVQPLRQRIAVVTYFGMMAVYVAVAQLVDPTIVS